METREKVRLGDNVQIGGRTRHVVDLNSDGTINVVDDQGHVFYGASAWVVLPRLRTAAVDAEFLDPDPAGQFETELAALLNKHSQENGSGTPDFILADYMSRCLRAFNLAWREREKWSRGQ